MLNSNVWSAAQIEALRNPDLHGLERLEAACLLYLEERDNLLCEMSAHDGEWPANSGFKRERRKKMKWLMRIVKNEADGLAAAEDQYWLICGVLEAIAKKHGYAPVVWQVERAAEGEVCP
jgi:hypothetical protein